MADIGTLLAEYGYILVVAFILFEQLGLPLPATPVMLGVGAAAATGALSLPLLIALGVTACVSADSVWFQMGRRYGHRVVRFLCRLTLAPDDCSRRSGDLYQKYGVMALVIAKFIPGLNTIAAPLAGLLGFQLHRFLFWDMVGASLWISCMLSLGYLFSSEVDALALWISHFGAGAALILAALLMGYVGLKLWVRQRFVARLRTVRIAPRILWARLQAGEALSMVDLRMPGEVAMVGATVPGAIRIPPEELEEHVQSIPEGREVVLYCSCPNEATSARAAMRLESLGVRQIRPLLGGYEGWVAAGLPVSSVRAVRLGKPGAVLYSNAPDAATTLMKLRSV